MKVGRNESWVTLVLDDGMGWEALVLAASLKRCYTQRKLTVFIDEKKVSDEMKALLQNRYDFMDTIQNASIVYTGKEVEDQAKMKAYIWSLLIWDKCVFLGSASLVLDSIEDLFQLGEFSAPALENGGRKIPCLDLFVFKPNRDTLNALSVSNANSGDEAVLKHFWKSWSTSPSCQLKDETWLPVEPSELHFHCPTPKVVKFDKAPWLPSENSEAIREKYTSKWLEIYFQDVLPEIQSNEKLAEFLKISTSKFELPLPSSPASPRTANLRSFDAFEDAIAIVGMSCRFPEANSVEEYWDLLTSGRCAVRKFPEGRRTFDLPGMQNLVAGFLSCHVDEFDAKFFGISPREAPLVDPQQRLLLEVIWESLEDAGLDGAALKDTPTGVFVGVLLQDYDRKLPRNGYIGNEYHHRFLGNAISATAGRISYYMGFTGPNLALESGSSSSLGALHLACQSLRSGEANLAITGGVNLILIPRYYNAAVKPFDESSDGFVSAEGVATVVLKRYADALNDGDKIRAIIRGSALGNDGGSVSFGTPVASSQGRVCKEALQNAGVAPGEVSYVEAHGTGTMMSDITEVTALSQVYACARAQPLLIGSVKTNVGHGQSSAGIASLFKLILALEREAIPQNLFWEKLNPELPLDTIPARVPTQLTPWAGPHRIGATSSFSMTGTLVHVLLESTPQDFTKYVQAEAKDSSVRPQLVTVSAKSLEALESQRQNYLNFFRKNAQLDLSDVAYATNSCRTHFQHRLAIAAENMDDLIVKLEQEDFVSGKVVGNSKSPPIGFLFTGQASQYFGMGKGLYNFFPAFRTTIDYCSGIYAELIGCPLEQVLWEDETLLQKTEYGQPALFCVQVALVKLWKHFGITPDIVLGHSVGEYCAAVAAGIISIPDGLRLVVGRSRLVEKLKPGRMVAIKASSTDAEGLMAQLGPDMPLDVAAVNSPTETVLSGSSAAVEAFETLCASRGIKAHRLASSHAFHSRDIDEILEEFGEVAEDIEYGVPNCPFISSTLGRKMEQEDFCTEYWQCHLRETVQFSTGIRLVSSVCQTLIEIGPQPVLLGLAMANAAASSQALLCCPSMRRIEENWSTFLTSLGKLHVAGVSVNWGNWFGKRVKNVQLPLYAFQRQKYWFVLEDYTHEEDYKDREGLHFQTKRIHPILGYKIPTPGARLLFAQSKLLTELPYLKECQIAENSILPPGGVLELFLAAANQLTQNSPLVMSQACFSEYMRVDGQTSIQTSVEVMSSEHKAWNVTLYKEAKGGEWNVVASTRVTNVLEEVESVAEFDWEKMRNAGVEEMSISSVYATQGEAQIHFGANYRRILQAWRTGDSKVVTKLGTVVQDPQTIGKSSSEYICYPTVLDAMVQTSCLAQRIAGRSHCLLHKIGKLVWYRKEASTGELMCYAGGDWVHIVTTRGLLIGKLEGLEFVSELSQAELQSGEQKTSNFMVPQWTPLPSAENLTKMDDKKYLAFFINNDDALENSRGQFIRIGLGGGMQGVRQVEPHHVEMNGLQHVNYEKLFQKYPIDGVNGLVYFWMDNNGEQFEYFRRWLEALRQVSTTYAHLPPVSIVCRGFLMRDEQMALDAPPQTPLIGWEMLQNFAAGKPQLKISVVGVDDDTFSWNELEGVLTAGSCMKANVFSLTQGQVQVQTMAPMALTLKLSLPHAERLAGTIQTNQVSHSFNSLQLKSIYAEGLGRGEVEVAVEACALNYRDIFQILRPDGFTSPSYSSLGYDISGRITAVSPTASKFNVGDEVFGVMTQGGGLSTHVRIYEGTLRPKPPSMSFASASTIPLAFLTAWKCLIGIAKLTAQDRVLVNLGLGGTGLAFIQICRHVGAKVFALADTEQGQEFLQAEGITHVYNSRTTDYVDRIQKDIDGTGVTVVVNSFSTNKFKEASLRACAPGAKFLEIGSLNLWDVDEVKKMRPDVDYHVVNLLGSEACADDAEIPDMLGTLTDLFEKYQLSPLPVKIFPFEYLKDAFASFHSGKFIGKTVVQMPAWAEEESSWKCQLFNKYATYLVTGELGESMWQWMVEKGAEYILIVATNIPPLQSFESKNHVERIHVRSYQECQKIQGRLHELGFPPLRGIFHEEELDGSGASNQDSLQTSTPWILHNLTTSLDLDFFVICNSGFDVNSSAGWICKQRQLAGLPATHISFPNASGGVRENQFELVEEILGRHLPSCVISTNTKQIPTVGKPSVVQRAAVDVQGGKKENEKTFAQKLELILRQTLRLPSSEAVDMDQNFTEIGVDSLMGLEIGTKIQDLLPHIQVSATVVQEYPTMRSILAYFNQ